MSDVSSTAPAQVRMWVSIDQHKLSLVAATLPASGGMPEVARWRTVSGRSAGWWRSSALLRVWRAAMRRGLAAISSTAC
jgi:hypothetical protein